MPEGDTIHRAAATLARALTGRSVTHFASAYAHVAMLDDQSPIAGRTVEEVRALGKHLLMRFSGGVTLRTHMRMNGSWHIYRRGERWQRPRSEMRVLVETDTFVAVAFNVPVAELLSDDKLERSAELNRLGPDLLAPELDVAAAVARLKAHGGLPAHEALLDQSVLAGPGNVYRSEILFLSRLPPDRPIGELSDEQLEEVVKLARKLMLANTATGASAGITTYFGLRRTTGRSNPGERLWVYGRRGKPCRRCGTPIAYRKVGRDVRGLYYCPRCQGATA